VTIFRIRQSRTNTVVGHRSLPVWLTRPQGNPRPRDFIIPMSNRLRSLFFCSIFFKHFGFVQRSNNCSGATAGDARYSVDTAQYDLLVLGDPRAPSCNLDGCHPTLGMRLVSFWATMPPMDRRRMQDILTCSPRIPNTPFRQCVFFSARDHGFPEDIRFPPKRTRFRLDNYSANMCKRNNRALQVC